MGEKKEDLQSSLMRDYAEEIKGRDVTDEEAESIICDELKDNDDDEYLVDGTLLTCTSAKWEDFELFVGKVHIDRGREK